MTLYCVIVSGRLPGDKDDASLWAPVAKAFNLDGDAFATQLLPRMPLMAKQGLEQSAASQLVEQLRAIGVDAVARPDDMKLALFQRDNTLKGPLPLSSLGDFIRNGERYRLRDATDWSAWGEMPPTIEAINFALPEFDAANKAPEFPPLNAQSVTSLIDKSHSVRPPVVAADEEPPPLPVAEHALQPHNSSHPFSVAASASDDLPPPFPDDELPPPFPDDELPPPFPDEEPRPLPMASASMPYVADGQSQAPEELPPEFVQRTAALHQPQFKASPAATQPSTPAPKVERAGRSLGLVLGSAVLFITLVGVAVGAYLYIAHQNDQAKLAGAQRPSSQSTPATQTQPNPPAQTAAAPAPVAKPFQPVEQDQQSVAQTAASAMDSCAVDSPTPRAPEEVALVANGNRHLTGKAERGGLAGEVYVVQAALGYDGQCRPDPYQIYIFRNQQLIGTAAPQAMGARGDGSITDFKLIDPQHLQVKVAHYGPNAPACCASSMETRVIDLDQLGGNSRANTITNVKPNAISSLRPSSPPSFDCQLAQSPTEIAICSNDNLSQLDGEMGHVYHEAMSLASPVQSASLKSAQRQWLRDREQQCTSDVACIGEHLRTRTQELRQISSSTGATAEVQNSPIRSPIAIAGPVTQTEAAPVMTDQEIQQCEMINHIEARTAEATSRLYGADYAAKKAVDDLKKRVSPACLERLAREANGQ